MFTALFLTTLLAATTEEPSDVRLAVSAEGAWTSTMRRSFWVDEPSDEAFPALRSGGSGGLGVELGITPVSIDWLMLFLGLHGRFGTWRGGAEDFTSMWDVGIRGRFELTLGPVHPWLGFTSSLGNLVIRSGGVERQVAAHTNDLSAGVRVQMGPVALGAFVETQKATSFARPQELFDTLRVAADITLTFDLGVKEPATDSPPSADSGRRR